MCLDTVEVVGPDAIRLHFTYLLKNVEIDGLVDHLFEKRVIDVLQIESLNIQPCIELRVERLLLILSKRSADDIEKFLEALQDSGKGFIAHGNFDAVFIQCAWPDYHLFQHVSVR